MKKLYGSACICAAVATGFAYNTFLTDFRWQSAVNGNWNALTAWDPDGVPNGPSDSVLIDATGANYTVTHNVTVTNLNSLTIDSANATLSSTGVNLSAGTIDIFSGRLFINSSTFSTTSGLTNMGLFELIGSPVVVGPVQSSGTLSVLSPGLNSNATFNNGLLNAGSLVMNNSGGGYSVTLTVNGGSLTNASGGVFDILPGSGGVRNIVSDFTNQGTTNISGNTFLARNGALTVNEGQLNVTGSGSLSLAQPSSIFRQAAGTLNVTGPFVVSAGGDFEFNGGTITGRPWISNATLVFGPSSTGSGAFDVNGTSTMSGNIGSNQAIALWGNGLNTGLTAAGSFTNAGLIEMQSASGGYAVTLSLPSGVLTNTGTLRTNVGTGGPKVVATDLVNNGTLQFNLATTLSKVNGVYTNAGQMNSPSGTYMGGQGQVFNQDAGAMDLTNGSFTIEGATFNFNGGTIIGMPAVVNGALTITGTGSGSVASMGNGTILGTIGTNKAVYVLGQGLNTTLNSSNGFTNNGSLFMNASGGGYLSAIAATAGTIQNNGSLNVESGSGGPRTIAGNFANAGTMNVNQPTTFSKNAGVYTNTGTINLTSGLSYAGLNQVFNQNSGPINGASNFSVGTATFNFNGGTVNGQPKLNASTLNIGGGATGAGNFMMMGSSALTGNIKAATTVHIQGNPNGSNAVLTSPSSFSNAGTILMDSASGGYGATLALTAGTLTNSGTLTVGPGTGGPRTITASFSNTGIINIDQPTTLNKSTGSYVNASGAVNLTQQLYFNAGGQTFSQNGGSITGGDNIFVDAAVLNFNGGTIAGQPRVRNGTLNIGAGASGAGSFLIMGGSAITGDIKAATTVQTQGNSTGSNGALTATNGFTNAGTMIFDSSTGGYGSSFTVSSGVLNNTGTFNVNVGTGGPRTVVAGLTNTGTVNINQPTTFQKPSGIITNAGGLFNVANTMVVNANAQTFKQTGGTLAASTHLNVTLGTFEYLGGTITGTPYLASSTLNIGPAASNPAVIRCGGSSTFLGNMLAGHEVWVNGNSSNSNAVLTSANGFSTAGTLRIESTEGGYGSSVSVTSGNLTVQPSGKVLIQPGTGGTRSVTCTLANNGLVEFNNSGSLGRLSATHSNTGILRVTGNQTATIVGSAFNSTGAGSVQGFGTVVVSGFSNGGTVAPGLPAPADQTSKLTVSGTHTQNALGAIDVDLAGFDQGNTYDWYAVTGAVVLDGRLVVRLLENFDPATGSEFTVITAPSITGTFSSLQLDKFPPNKSAEIIYSATSVKVRIKDGIRVNADSYLVTIGEEFQGNLNSLFTTDNNSLSLFPDPVSQFAQIEITGTATVSTPIAIRFSFEGRVERLGIAQATQMFNYTNNNWVFIDSRVGTTQDSAFDSNIGVNAPQFVGPAGIIKARVTWQPINDEDPTQDGWLHAIDVATWTLTE